MVYFTKSRFRQALDCPTKLYYGANSDVYENQNLDDPFLMALAEGGYQVGELAKYLFSNDPTADKITVTAMDYDGALEATMVKRKQPRRIVIAEAAFRYENFFIRTDLFVEKENILHIYEVKAKSWDNDTTFLKPVSKGPLKGTQCLDSNWSAYLYDVAFQKYVVMKANPGKKVKVHLILVDKTTETSIDGLNQLFKIERNDKRITIKKREGDTRSDLGTIPLKIINVDAECAWIFDNPVDIHLEEEYRFEELLVFLCEKYNNKERIWSAGIGRKCKECEYINIDYPEGLRSGFHECWMHIAGIAPSQFKDRLILELWGGLSGSLSHINKAVDNSIFFMKQLDESLYAPKNRKLLSGDTLDATKRRTIQVKKSKTNDFTPYLDLTGLRDVFDELPAPYHLIDFETTMVALPFHKNRKPYEAVAFQYSYHLMDGKGNITHKSQYLSFEKGYFPNYDFLRHLKANLSGKPGTIFRYHNHENSYLNHIYKQLLAENETTVLDKNALLAFVREIAHPSGDTPDKWTPSNDMQDLYKLVLNHFYSLYAKGSNSTKDILPAVIKSLSYIQEKYSKPVYGTPEMPSLNFTAPHVWITGESGLNPYKTLPDLFTKLDRVNLDLSDHSLFELNNGGAAMIAYSYLQFTDLPEEQRVLYRDGLLRYCELDTMAMVMIWDYWGRELGKW